MVSIIVPVYNVQDYILKCLRSVADQTFPGSIECLIIDDVGLDESITLAEEFIRTYRGDIDFRIIHHKCNKGLSAARNTGIIESKGQWLFFLDSDDWISPDCIELMMAQVEIYPKVEMVMGNINTIGAEYNWKFADPGIYTDGFVEKSCEYQIYTMAWNKLLSKDFILSNKLFFEEGIVHEDVLWYIKCACYLNVMVSLGEKTYNYMVRPNSIQTNKSYEFHYTSQAIVKEKTIRFIFESGFERNVYLYKYIVRDLYVFLLEPFRQGKGYLAKEFYKRLKRLPFWSISFVNKNKSCRKELIMALNRYLPSYTGLTYLKVVDNLYSKVH